MELVSGLSSNSIQIVVVLFVDDADMIIEGENTDIKM